MTLAGLLLLVFICSASAQSTAGVLQPQEPYRLAVGYFKTTSLIFPYTIVGVDRGSRDILVQKAKGAENILQLKAARDSFPETNLTVVTADGALNSFVVNYTPAPSGSSLKVAKKGPSPAIFPSGERENQAELKSYAQAAALSEKKLHWVRQSDYGMDFSLSGLFIHENTLYFRLVIDNQSQINYDIGQLRFFIRDQKKAKRTASQEIEFTPLYVHDASEKVAGLSGKTMVYALPKFTIPDKKNLIIQLMEAGGGRHLELRVKNKKLLKVVLLP